MASVAGASRERTAPRCSREDDRVARTEGPDGMSAPQIATLNRTEVAVPQVKRRTVLSVARYVRRVGRVPPRVPGERADGRHW